jgi:flagellar protein FlbD
MIRLTRRNSEPIVVNLMTIAYVEATPDTLVTLTTGERLHVKETVEEVVARSLAYQQKVARPELKPAEGR